MAGSVAVWLLGAFAKSGRQPEPPAQAAADAEDDGVGAVARVSNGRRVQEKRRRDSGALSGSEETVVCMLMDLYAPA
jgi:hypothetical protein